MAKIKISQLTAKGANLASTDLLPIAEVSGAAYVTKRITGAQAAGGVTLTVGSTSIVSGTIGRVLFQGTGNVLQQSANLFWDNSNSRLGVGTASPSQTLDVNGDINTNSVLRTPFIRFQNTSNGIDITSSTVTIPTGNFGIGAAPTGNTKLDVRALNASASDIGIRLRDSTNAKDLFSVSNTGVLRVTHPTFTGELQVNFSANNTLKFNHTVIGEFMTVGFNATNTVNFEGQTVQALSRGGQFASNVTGLTFAVNISGIPAASSGTVNVDALRINPTINNTGTYSGIIRGIFYNPSIVSLVGTTHRAIETVRGDVVFSSTNGNVAIGGTSFGTSSDKVFAQYNGTSPGSSPADAFQMYSADIVGGNASPHFRTENGDIIKLYQETTAVASATFVQNSGNRVDEVSTFDGYTIAQVVKALRNLGILA